MPSTFSATVTDITITDPNRPLRRDAERNRERILDAARELFAQRGLGVTLNDVAHHAGVGVGTVYRRFPDKSRLIDELFEQRVEELVALAEGALADPDPWRSFTGFLEALLEHQAQDRGLKDLIVGMPDGPERVCRIRDRLAPIGTQLVARAQEAGALRGDIAPSDVPIIQLMLSTVSECAHDADPELWRRYFQIVVRGLAADPAAVPPPSRPPLPLDQVPQVMAHMRPSRG